MTDLMPADQIEQIVGARRHALAHLGRAMSAEQTVYILMPDEDAPDDIEYLSVWDASVPPGGMVCGACGMPTESEPCAQHQGEA